MSVIRPHLFFAFSFVLFMGLLVPSTGAQTADEFFDRGLAALKSKNFKEAADNFARFIQLDPTSPFAFNNRGMALSELGDYDNAIADFNQAIKMKSNVASIYSNRGTTYLRKRDFDRAIDDFARAVSIDPSHAPSYFGRGIAHAGKDNFDQAILEYTQAIQLNPRYSRAYSNRGEAYYQKQNYEQAILDSTEAIRLDPTDSTSYSNRGISLAHTHRYSDAIQDFDKALTLNSKRSWPLLGKAWTYIYLNDEPAAHRSALSYLKARASGEPIDLNAVLAGYVSLRKAKKRTEAIDFIDSWIKDATFSEWDMSIIKFLRGDLMEDQLMANADDIRKLTKARTYIGELHMLNGRPELAKPHFIWVRDNGVRLYFEYELAVAELKLLNAYR